MPTYQARVEGIYRCKYLGCEEREFTNPDTSEVEPRWVWRFQELADPTTAGLLDKITGTSPKSANSNAYKMMAGVLGHPPTPGDDTEAHIGALYDVVYGRNQGGNLTITSVMKVGPTGSSVASGPAAGASLPAAGPTTPEDDLPF